LGYRIYLSPPIQNGTESVALQSCLESNWLAPVGPALNQFEFLLEEIFINKSVVALNSGTAAIHLALVMSGVKHGDEVLVATHTHNATVNPIIYQGATPVFVDSEEFTWNLSPHFLEQAIEDRIKKGKKPKALILVHLYGMPADLDSILKICRQYDVAVIEDAAESLGSTYNNHPLGSFGDFGILSFNGNKIVTSGGGGALICSTPAIREKALYFATQAREDTPHFQHSEIGYNYRLSNVLAALGSAQLTDLQERVHQRRKIFNGYKELFTHINTKIGAEAVSWIDEPKNSFSNRWLSTFLVQPVGNIAREDWRLSLERESIESRPLWKPMHLQPVFEQYPYYGDHTADRIFQRGICLPSGGNLTRQQIEEITSIIYNLYT
jgi:dTDP-4-amino-4,6-dideoxygalactose transaminase